MNELRRILDDEPDQTMRALLDAARSDAPPDDAARSRTLLALGVGATTGAALTAGAVKLGASPGGPLAKVLSPLVLKWMVPLGLSATLGLGAVGYVEHRHAVTAASRLAGQERGAVEQAAATAATVASHAAASPGRAAAAVAPSSVALDEALDVAPAPTAEPLAPVVATMEPTVSAAPPVAAPTVSLPRASPPTTTATAAAPTSTPTPPPPPTLLTAPMTTAAAAASGSAEHDAALAAEVQRLDQAQAALTRHRPRVALGLLDMYTREFPRGSLAPEATLMRIDALLLAGDRPAAEALAASFVAARAGAPYAARVHALLAR